MTSRALLPSIVRVSSEDLQGRTDSANKANRSAGRFDLGFVDGMGGGAAQSSIMAQIILVPTPSI